MVISGHLWEIADIHGIASSVIWKSVSAQASNDGNTSTNEDKSCENWM